MKTLKKATYKFSERIKVLRFIIGYSPFKTTTVLPSVGGVKTGS